MSTNQQPPESAAAASKPTATRKTNRSPRPAPAPKRASSKRRKSRSAQDAICGEPMSDWQVKHAHAAGIDIGSREHWVSVGRGRAEPSVRRFGTCTPDLDEMVQWLRACGIRQVAMESTGMYWLPVYEKLEEEGFEVILVDARPTKHTAGRKSDLSDCEWIAQLHTYGLLRAAFRPTDAVCRLRTLQRHRRALVESSSRHVLHMQKALDGMNLHVHHALSDLTGVSGLAMMDAIVQGERDPQKLAALAQPRVKKTPAQLAAALTGHYREEELFVLGQALASYRHCQQQIVACEEKVVEQLHTLQKTCAPESVAEKLEVEATAGEAPGPETAKPTGKSYRRPGHKKMEAGLAQTLRTILGVDLTQLPGLAVMAVLTLLSEIGTDMSRWRNAKAFTSWLGLCPNHRISGGRLLSNRSRKVVNRAATALRMAAVAAGQTNPPLGGFYRRQAAQLGKPKAITATARKLACLVYEMVQNREEYRASDASAYQKRYDEHRLKAFRKRAREMGYELVELQKAA